MEYCQVNSKFNNNSAYVGGAIFFNGFINENIFLGNFTNNKATRTGGAIYVKSYASGNQFCADFNHNYVEDISGGAITFSRLAYNNTFEGKFEYNVAWYGGAIFFYRTANDNKFNAIFSHNYAVSCGGALFFYNLTNNNIFNSRFISNTAKTGNGGAVTFKNTSRNCVFNGDLINNTGYIGGGLNYWVTPFNITYNCNFINNTGTLGGAIHFFENSSNLYYNGDFINNSAIKGGAICADKSFEIENVSFINNKAEYGGAIYITQLGSVRNITFKDNAAKFGGGALYMGNKTQVNNCIFDGNEAPDGAAIFIKSKFDGQSHGLPFDPDSGNGTYDNETFWNETDLNETDWNESDGDPFDENQSLNESDVDVVTPEIFINDSIFKNMHNTFRGAIYCDYQNKVCINNTAFDNLSSEYAPAIYCVTYNYLFGYNCNFTNLVASKSGGAIALMDNVIATLDNCTFINASSSKNAGAIYMDENGWATYSPSEVTFTNSKFINCSSGYGGALVQLGGALTISNTTFENNFATYKGGAAYVVNRQLNITSTKFSNNRLGYSDDEELSLGGALYLDFITEDMIIADTQFINNSRQAVYCYDCIVNITNCYFENNTEAIRSVCAKSMELGENNYTTDILIENDTDSFRFVVEGVGIKLELINNTIIIEELPSRFDSRDWGWVTPVKSQGFSGACWCFSTISVLETALLKATGISYDLSEQNIQKLSLFYYKYGELLFGEPGLTNVALQYLLSWLGPIPEEYDTFDMIGKITRPISTFQNIHIQDAILIPMRANVTDNDGIKRAIIKYGSVTTDFLSDKEAPNFNENTSAYYCNKIEFIPASHAVAIVGWDDNYPASNFVNMPPGDGAWIIKNSYGNESFDEGYVYISYYDTIMSIQREGVAFVIENTENYTKNYQTDMIGDVVIHTESDSYSYKNSYQSVGNDLISAVGTYFNKECEDYSLEIYVNNALKLTQEGLAPFRGFHTVKLTKDIPIKEGDNFTVIMKTHSVPIFNSSRMHYKADVSFVDDGSGWKDASLENSTVVLKVYTKDLPDPLTTTVSAPAVSTVYNGGKYLTVTLKDIYGDPIYGANVSVKINGVSKTLITDKNGKAKMLLNDLAPKTYTASIVFAGNVQYAKSTNSVKVIVKKATVKLTAKSKTFRYGDKTKKYVISLKTNKNKAMKNTKVALKVNGKTYFTKTNYKGIATFKLTKLTKKGKFTAIVKYGGNNYYNAKTVKPKITVR